jgi:hypothetical protein
MYLAGKSRFSQLSESVPYVPYFYRVTAIALPPTVHMGLSVLLVAVCGLNQETGSYVLLVRQARKKTKLGLPE